MKNVTITEINGKGDVDFDQEIDTDTVIASGGGVAVNGNANGALFNTGVNTGVLAGDDVNFTDSILGNGNTQVNDSDIGAFSGRGDATNIQAENANLGSGDLIDVDSEGDAQVVTGNANDVTGDVDVDAKGIDGPLNLAVGHDIDQTLLEDESFNADDSFNTDASTDDSFNTAIEDSGNTLQEETNTATFDIDDSFNTFEQDNDISQSSWKTDFEQNFDLDDDAPQDHNDDFTHFLNH